MNVKRTTVAAISLTDCVSTLQEVIIADVNLDTNYKKTAKLHAKVKKIIYNVRQSTFIVTLWTPEAGIKDTRVYTRNNEFVN